MWSLQHPASWMTLACSGTEETSPPTGPPTGRISRRRHSREASRLSAIIEDEATGGVFTLFLYADGSVADEWQQSLEDALSALEETNEFDGLPWAD